MKPFTYPMLLTLLLVSLHAQQGEESRKKPVLIRADRTTESVEETSPARDPEKAKENVKIGDFYYKRDNYKAAEDRYREAILYNPQWSEAYERLIRSLEKQQAFDEAAKVCQQFLDTNPPSQEAERFQEWAEKLKKESNENRTGG